ncbi:ParB/RepB/Spo0J family partition protein [Lutimaribacter marinistellae]|uniref:ParB/RepB/Spo0J family partition protein n=1 Tax=Lutimaribacter marinistellae TaxID=1820329 RepID=A0ABV7TFF7_9RHOB
MAEQGEVLPGEADMAAVQAAMADGRVIELLPVGVIDAEHLVRDRLAIDADEMQALTDSLRRRGQQMPIEVVPLPRPGPNGETHGLVSGWRRLTALRRLAEETGDPAFATVRAMVVTPDTAQDAYLAMVEENEIRVNLSHYERARIACKAMEEGVFANQRAALQGLFGNATRSKRSKIGTFIVLVDSFDDVLRFPSSISEKLGLALAREMVRDPSLTQEIREALAEAKPVSALDEMRLLAAMVTARAEQAASPERTQEPRAAAERTAREVTRITEALELRFDADRGRIELVGADATDTLAADLRAWLTERLGASEG